MIPDRALAQEHAQWRCYRGREGYKRHDPQGLWVVVEEDHCDVRDHYQHHHRHRRRTDVLLTRNEGGGRGVEGSDHHETDREQQHEPQDRCSEAVER